MPQYITPHVRYNLASLLSEDTNLGKDRRLLEQVDLSDDNREVWDALLENSTLDVSQLEAIKSALTQVCNELAQDNSL